MGDLDRSCQQAEALVERLPAITNAVQAAKELDATVRRTVDHAEKTCGKLVSTEADISRRCAELASASSASEELIEKQERLAIEAQRASDQFAERVDATAGSVEAGEQVMREFVAQSRELQGGLDDLRRKAAAIEESLEQATVKPNQIIAVARAQAAQLEQVCAAVRKVFSGLAGSTLDAKRQMEELRGTSGQVNERIAKLTKEFRSTSGQANERLAKLTAETDHASNTLQEWVREARSVQSRLDTTLQRCPSISQTHPGDSLDAVAEIAQPLPRVADPTVDFQEVNRETDLVGKTQPARPQPDGGASSRHTKMEEINSLIEQAKNAARIGS